MSTSDDYCVTTVPENQVYSRGPLCRHCGWEPWQAVYWEERTSGDVWRPAFAIQHGCHSQPGRLISNVFPHISPIIHHCYSLAVISSSLPPSLPIPYSVFFLVLRLYFFWQDFLPILTLSHSILRHVYLVYFFCFPTKYPFFGLFCSLSYESLSFQF